MHDRRGTGSSDPADRPPTVDEQAEDLIAVLDELSIGRFALVGTSEASRMAAYTAATHPERVTSLVLHGLSPQGAGIQRPEVLDVLRNMVDREWATPAMLHLFAPSLADDERFGVWWGRYMRMAASPRVAKQFLEFALKTDVTDVLPTIRVPTLVTHRTGDRLAPVEDGRAAAKLIPGARFVELPGDDNLTYGDRAAELMDEIESFLTGTRRAAPTDRILATVLFTDIVDSTRQAAALGDAAWRALLDRHDAVVRDVLADHGGREVKTTGDGFLAAFDGPARAIAAAGAIDDRTRAIGVEVRAGIHTGECERRGEDLGGMAVHIGARIAALAGAGEVLVSSTVRDLTVGSGFEFDDRGEHELKGVPGQWRVLAVRD
jgi:class 3 adenylate cyclase